MRVCLVLEGSYPYVYGGVSTWMHGCIRAMPEHEFVLWVIGAKAADRGKFVYQLPANVAEVHEVFLDDALRLRGGAPPVHFTPEECAALRELVRLGAPDWEVLFRLFHEKRAHPLAVLQSREFMALFTKLCEEEYPYTAFADAFHTVRSMLLPVLWLMTGEVPEADCYHAICTGYGGLLACLGGSVHHRPVLLTEHGIYTREREEEIIRAEWVAPDFKARWTRFFYMLSEQIYRQADRVTSLFPRARSIQIGMGCEPGKCIVIPNGVDYEKFCAIPPKAEDGWVDIGAVVRLAPIKDIKTLLYAFLELSARCQNVRLHILGGVDDEEYARECYALAEQLGLENVRFTGRVDIAAYLQKLDFTILTSISEGQPLSVLESLAARRPCVTTDVGCCRELLEGTPGDTLGAAGFCVPAGAGRRHGEALRQPPAAAADGGHRPAAGGAELPPRADAGAVSGSLRRNGGHGAEGEGNGIGGTMAGIGFELKKLFRRKGMLAGLRAYGYAGIICTGPMLLGVLLQGGLLLLCGWAGAPRAARDLLVCMVTYTLLASLTVTSFFSMPVTRFVADQLYEERAERVLPSFAGACAVQLALGCGGYGAFLLASGATFCQGLLCLWLFAELVVCWTAMSYLTALKEYRGILLAFAAAVGAAFGAGWVLVFWLGVPVVEGFLAATALGYGVMLGLDVRLLCRFFPEREGSPWRFLRWVKRYRTLALTGLLLDLGLFAHLVIVWLGPLGVQVKGLFYGAPYYDVPALLAFLSILTTTVNFVVSVEVQFYPRYRTYYSLFNDGGVVGDIKAAEEEMLAVLNRELYYTALKQLFTTAAVISLETLVLGYLPLGFNDLMHGCLRTLCAGYGLYAVGNTVLLILLYFTDYKGALGAAAAFAVLAGGGTALSLRFDPAFYGFGFLAGAAVLFLAALLRLDWFTRNLPYRILGQQPLAAAEEKDKEA